MAKFDAAKAVDPVEWDFTAYGGGSGVTPEPSRGQIIQFEKEMKRLSKSIRAIQRKADALEKKAKDENLPPEELDKMIDALEDEVSIDQMDAYEDAVTEAIAELCGGSPSVEDMNGLPFRIKEEFAKFVIQEFRPSPESQRPGSK